MRETLKADGCLEICAIASFGNVRAETTLMDENQFKKHLRDLAHGHHHPEEHDWTAPAKGAKSVAGAKDNAPQPS